MKSLDELESRLQSLVEDHLVKVLPGYRPEDRLARMLAVAMHGSLVESGNAVKAPNVYTILAHPATTAAWNAQPHLLEELADALHETGREAGLVFSSQIRVVTTADENLKENEVHVQASFGTEPLTETRGLPAEEPKPADAPAETIPANAFLILAGTKVYPLKHAIVNIGRRLDNQLVIDDPRVSRNHAQLRAVKGRYVLFDLESTGGTYVNGQRASQTVLYPGDVISLAGVTLIFGQDLPTGRIPEDFTEPGSSVSADRPTAVLKPNQDQ